MSRQLPLLRRAFPRARILVRLDGGFASPAVVDFLEAQPRLDYVVAMAKNAVLERYAEPAMLVARARTWRSEQTAHVYVVTNEYQAGTWNHARRVVIEAEVVSHRERELRDNPRFVVTNMRQTAAFPLREGLLRPRGRREPDQGTEGPTDRPHELPDVFGESVARPADGGGLRADAGVAAVRRRYRVRPRAGALAARPAAEARRPGGVLGASHRPAPAARDTGPGGVAAYRVRARGARRIAARRAPHR